MKSTRLAQRVEDRNSLLRLGKFGPHPSWAKSPLTPFSPSLYNQLPSSQTTSPPNTRHIGQRSGSSFRRLTNSELQQKGEKCLCFHCDEKYSIGHRCKNKELHVLMVSDDLDLGFGGWSGGIGGRSDDHSSR